MSQALEGAPRASSVSLRARPVHPRHLARLLVTGLALAAVLVPVVASGPVAARDATPAIRSTRSLPARVHPGHAVARQGLAARAPARGGFAFGMIEGTDGRTRSIYLHTTADGRVRVGALEEADGTAADLVSADSATAAGTASTGLASSTGVASVGPDCRDTSRVLFPWRVVMLKWTVDPRGAPLTLRDPVGGNTLLVKALRRAQHDITWGRNACGRPDRIQALGWFTRRTDRVAGISAAGGCTGADGQSTISFGSLPYPTVAMTCVYGVKRDVATEADIRINTNARWALRLTGCSGPELLLEAVIAHEFGHVYGLGHTPSSPYLTMSPIIRYCDASNVTLGIGDLLGLESKNR